MKTKVIEIYSVAKHPDEATPQQKAAIVARATAGVGGLVGGTAACVKAREVAGRASFNEYKRNTLPHEIAKQTGWAIEKKGNFLLFLL